MTAGPSRSFPKLPPERKRGAGWQAGAPSLFRTRFRAQRLAGLAACWSRIFSISSMMVSMRLISAW